MEEQEFRADTPDSEGGGYFTLSESETGSNNEIEYRDIRVFNFYPVCKDVICLEA